MENCTKKVLNSLKTVHLSYITLRLEIQQNQGVETDFYVNQQTLITKIQKRI